MLAPICHPIIPETLSLYFFTVNFWIFYFISFFFTVWEVFVHFIGLQVKILNLITQKKSQTKIMDYLNDCLFSVIFKQESFSRGCSGCMDNQSSCNFFFLFAYLICAK